MIVICINGCWYDVHNPGVPANGPIKDNLYEVIDEVWLDEYNGVILNKLYYQLREFPDNWYSARQFREIDVDISDAVERELEPNKMGKWVEENY